MRLFFLLLPALLAACQPEDTRRGEPERSGPETGDDTGSGAPATGGWTVIELTSEEVIDSYVINEDGRGYGFELPIDLNGATVLAVSAMGKVGGNSEYAQDVEPITEWRIVDGVLLIGVTVTGDMRIAYLTQ